MPSKIGYGIKSPYKMKGSPIKWAWLAALVPKVAGALGVKAAAGAAAGKAIAAFGKSAMGKAIATTAATKGVEMLTSRSKKKEETSPDYTGFSRMKFGTGGNSAFSFKSKSPVKNYKKGYYGL